MFGIFKDSRPWAIRRRLLYAGPPIIIFFVYGLTTVLLFLFGNPTCFDGRENGSETGRDCGGACVRICAYEVQPPKVIWVNSFKIFDGQYNSVAYVENINQTAGSLAVPYTITLYNGEAEVARREGVTELPPNTLYPIFEGRIETVNDAPITETKITLEPPEVWQPATIDREQFFTRTFELTNADVRPRLTAELDNTSIFTVDDLEVVATIFNDENQPVTASQTKVDEFLAESTQTITFTWPSPIAKTVRSCIVPTDVVMAIDLSGSMNNDNENPPQPLTDALTAASTFTRNLSENDGVGLVTFASFAELTAPLTNDADQVAREISNLAIQPAEETGFTNTLAALEVAARELNSENHNPDARRVMVILTDGLPTDPDDERRVVEEAEALADQLDLSGIEIYAIGLGEAVDRDFIRALASNNETAYFAPTGANLSTELTAIYDSITNSICETGPTRIDIIPRIQADFTPLR
jgi:Mg-chelatase subunit ChlD